MATFLPETQRPFTDFTASSPPEYANGNLLQAPNAFENAHDPNDPRDYRPSLDFPPMGSNGNGPVRMPKGPTSHLPTNRGRHRNTTSMGTFEGPRSPPNAKNTAQYVISILFPPYGAISEISRRARGALAPQTCSVPPESSLKRHY